VRYDVASEAFLYTLSPQLSTLHPTSYMLHHSAIQIGDSAVRYDVAKEAFLIRGNTLSDVDMRFLFWRERERRKEGEKKRERRRKRIREREGEREGESERES